MTAIKPLTVNDSLVPYNRRVAQVDFNRLTPGTTRSRRGETLPNASTYDIERRTKTIGQKRTGILVDLVV